MAEEYDDDIDNYTDDNLAFEDDIDDQEQQNEESNFKVISYKDVIENSTKKEKKTIPYLSKFEKARIIGNRAQQLAYGAQPKINTENLLDIYEIATEELKQRKIPFITRRTLPNGLHEDWRIEEFEFI